MTTAPVYGMSQEKGRIQKYYTVHWFWKNFILKNFIFLFKKNKNSKIQETIFRKSIFSSFFHTSVFSKVPLIYLNSFYWDIIDIPYNIHPFQLYSLMIFSIFTKLCNNSTTFSSLQQKSLAIGSHFLFSRTASLSND